MGCSEAASVSTATALVGIVLVIQVVETELDPHLGITRIESHNLLLVREGAVKVATQVEVHRDAFESLHIVWVFLQVLLVEPDRTLEIALLFGGSSLLQPIGAGGKEHDEQEENERECADPGAEPPSRLTTGRAEVC